MNGKRKRKARRKVPLAVILTLVLLSAGLSIILVPALLKDMQLNREAREYETLVERAKSVHTAAPLDAVGSATPTSSPFKEEKEAATTLSQQMSVGGWLTSDPQVGQTPNAKSAAPEQPITTQFPQDSSGSSGHSSPTDNASTGSSGQNSLSDELPQETEEEPPAPIWNTGADLAACHAANGDFVAWLQIPGTKIDYPVVLSDDIDYYLNHTFVGTESKLGTLFSLGKTDYQTPGKNIAIYGHHIRSSSSQKMFQPLNSYKRQSYYAKHATIYLDTLYRPSVYTIFAVIDMTSGEWDASTASFASGQEFTDFIDRAKALSLYDTGVAVTAADRILTLITCDRDFGGASGRLVIMAVER